MKTILLNYEARHQGYLPRVSQMLTRYGVVRVISSTTKLTKAMLDLRVDQFDVEGVIICHPQTQLEILETRLGRGRIVAPEKWGGTVLHDWGVPVMIGMPFNIMHVTGWGAYAFEAHIQKFVTNPLKEFRIEYDRVNKLNWKLCLGLIKQALLVAIDIETCQHKTITMVGYACLMPSGKTKTFVADLRTCHDLELYQFIKEANATPPPKVFHNGTYDNQYFLQYGFPVYNWTLDTEYMSHAVLSETPLSLAFITALHLPTAEYWKDTGSTDLVRYNALDCYNTLHACISILHNWTPEAMANYQELFPLTTVALNCAFEGLLVDQQILKSSREKAAIALDEMEEELSIMCGGDLEFNAKSPKQVQALLYNVLGAAPVRVKGKLGGTDALTLEKLSKQHPLLARYISHIVKIRKTSKAISTYYDAKLYDGRLLYSYRVDGTTTGRMSCKQSNFGPDNKSSYGAQVQNIPPYMKDALIPDEGYLLGEVDNSQSEARCTAYLANDEGLIEALENPKDFYKICGELFFNIPYEQITKELRNKVIKKIIHGTNYMMQEQTFLDVVGAENLIEASAKLNRPKNESLLSFAKYLLSLYHEHYPNVQNWYKSTAMELVTKGYLTSVLGQTRAFLSDPTADATLRAAVAHQPQSLSVTLINRAFVQAFWKLQLGSNGDFKVKAQVHDSILFQVRKGKENYYKQKVEELMQQEVKFPSGKVMVIPTDGSVGVNWLVCH